MECRVASSQVLLIVTHIRRRLKRVVGGDLRVRDASAGGTTESCLIVEVEFKIPLIVSFVVLDLEAIADAWQTRGEGVVLSRSVLEELRFRCEVLELEIRICRVFAILCCQQFVQNLAAWEASFLP